jgi:hypothetical protein
MRKVREIIALPFMFCGFILIAIGMIIGFGFRTFEEFSDEFNKHFN